MARSRIFRPLAQALIVLLFLAWLPAIGDSGFEDSLLFQAGEAFSLSELPDAGEPDRDPWNDGKGGADVLILPAVVSHSNSGLCGQHIYQCIPDAVLHAHVLGARHATGPPGFRS